MMKKRFPVLRIVFLVLACFSLVALSAGGEYLHSIIHHHNHGAFDQDCPFAQLLLTAFWAIILCLGTLKARPRHRPPTLRGPSVSPIRRAWPLLRGPPHVLA